MLRVSVLRLLSSHVRVLVLRRGPVPGLHQAGVLQGLPRRLLLPVGRQGHHGMPSGVLLPGRGRGLSDVRHRDLRGVRGFSMLDLRRGQVPGPDGAVQLQRLSRGELLPHRRVVCRDLPRGLVLPVGVGRRQAVRRGLLLRRVGRRLLDVSRGPVPGLLQAGVLQRLPRGFILPECLNDLHELPRWLLLHGGSGVLPCVLSGQILWFW
jgi:hypothetical protein